MWAVVTIAPHDPVLHDSLAHQWDGFHFSTLLILDSSSYGAERPFERSSLRSLVGSSFSSTAIRRITSAPDVRGAPPEEPAAGFTGDTGFPVAGTADFATG